MVCRCTLHGLFAAEERVRCYLSGIPYEYIAVRCFLTLVSCIVDVLLKEIEGLAQECLLFGQTACVQRNLTPLYNILRRLRGLNEQPLASLSNHIISSDEFHEQKADLEVFLMYEAMHVIVSRDFDKAQQITEKVKAIVNNERRSFNYIILEFYVGLVSCYFARQRGETEEMEKTTKVCDRLEELLRHSRWNMENKFWLLKAECQYTERNFIDAAKSYDNAITAATNHKFDHELALGE